MANDNQSIPILELYRWPSIDNQLAKEMYFAVLERSQGARIQLENLHDELKYATGEEHDSKVHHIYRVFTRYNALHEAAEIMLRLADKEKDKR